MIRRKYVDDGKVVALPSYPEITIWNDTPHGTQTTREDWSMRRTRSTRSWSIYSTWFRLIAVIMIDCIPQGILPYQTWQRTVVVEVVVWFKKNWRHPDHSILLRLPNTCRNDGVPSTRADRIVSVWRRRNFPSMDGDEWCVFKIVTTNKVVEILMYILYIQSIDR